MAARGPSVSNVTSRGVPAWLRRMPMRVLVAFDKFKDGLSAGQACAIAAGELRRLHPDWFVQVAPLTDGGDGFGPILAEAAQARVLQVAAAGPRLGSREASIALVDPARVPVEAREILAVAGARPGPLAVIEMAAINGLALVPQANRDPWRTTSFGTGQLIRAAAELGAATVLLGVGGSATNDLGLGALQALGLEFRDQTGSKVRPPFPAVWERIGTIDGEVFASIPPIVIACDVANPLLGAEGAAAVFGAQKGLLATDLPRLEMQAARLAQLLCAHCGKNFACATNEPGAGAAGGIAFGLMVAARARLAPGFSLVASWLDLESRVAAADIVITGEGCFDASSASGKGPGAIRQLAQKLGRRAIVFAGAVQGDLAREPDVHAITPEGTPLPQALADTARNLAAAVARVVP